MRKEDDSCGDDDHRFDLVGVGVEEPLHEEAREPVLGEHEVDGERGAEDRAEVQRKDVDEWNEGVAKRVIECEPSIGDTFGSSGNRPRSAERNEHGRPHVAAVRADETGGERDDGQREVANPIEHEVEARSGFRAWHATGVDRLPMVGERKPCEQLLQEECEQANARTATSLGRPARRAPNVPIAMLSATTIARARRMRIAVCAVASQTCGQIAFVKRCPVKG